MYIYIIYIIYNTYYTDNNMTLYNCIINSEPQIHLSYFNIQITNITYNITYIYSL